MSTIKQLLSQTAIYGLSSVIGRVLNFLLVPLYTGLLNKEEFGEITILYSLVAIFNVFLSYGMETGYFNFVNKSDPSKVFATSFSSITFTTVLFLAISLFYVDDIAFLLDFQNHPEYILYLIWVLAFDAITVIPFARLRALNKAFRFSIIKLTSIAIYIGSNILLLVIMPALVKTGYSFGGLTEYFSKPSVSMIFVSNLLSSAIVFVMILPTLFKIKWDFDFELLKKMLSYSWPILIAGTAGIINETMDKQILFWMLPEDVAKGEIGIYGANYKISIFMTLFIQAFRMGVEPFFFSKSKDADAKETYSKVMNIFVAIMSVIYLFIMANLEIFKHFIQNKEMWTGIDVVPILLMANLFLGIYINLSVWYKINDKTKYGALFSIIGAIVTIVVNIGLIPILGFRASAWATLAAYGIMMTSSLIVGQFKYPIPYKFAKMIIYIGFSTFFSLLSFKMFNGNVVVGNVFLLLFMLMILFFESNNLKSIFVKRQ